MMADLLWRWYERGWKRTAAALAYLLAGIRPGDAGACTALARFAAARSDAQGMKRWSDAALRRRPSDAEMLQMAGALKLAANDAEGAVAHFSAIDRMTGGAGIVTKAYRQQHLDLAAAQQGLPYYRRLDHVLVDTAYWSIMTPQGVVYSANVHGRNLVNSPFIRGRMTPDGAGLIASYPEPAVRIEAECILVGGDDNYSHWLFRNLLKLAALDEALLQGHPWLLNDDLKPYQAEYLDLLGVSPQRRRLVPRGRVIACDRLIVPTLLTSKRAIAMGVDWLRERFATLCVPEGEAQSLVYVSRAEAARRHVSNEDELAAALIELGFQVVVPGRCSVREQIRAFSSAQLIVAVHGAGLTNMIYAPAHARYIEIVSTALEKMDDFRRIARARGQTMTTIVSDDYGDAREIHPNADYRVDVDVVVGEVRRALSALASRRA